MMSDKASVLEKRPWVIKNANCSLHLSDDAIDYADGVFFLKETGELCAYIIPDQTVFPEVLVLPKEVRILPSSFRFGYKGMKKLVIKGDIDAHDFSFQKCALEEIVFEGNMIYPSYSYGMANEAFRSSEQLRSVVLPKGIYGITSYAFFGCPALTHVELPDRLKHIGRRAFSNCSSLTEVFVPDGVRKIEKEAFYCCSSLKRISLPASLEQLQGNVFQGCYKLQTIEFRGTKAQWDAVKKGHEEEDGSFFQDFSRVGYDYAYSSPKKISWNPTNKEYQMIFRED